MSNQTFPHKNIRLHRSRYLGRVCHFITICCERRRPLFANETRAAQLIKILQTQAAAHRFTVHAYCVMPDHLHMLVSGLDDDTDLLAFVKSFKRASQWDLGSRLKNPNPPTEKRARKPRATVAATKPALWQKKFYDHILRQGEPCDAVAGYIWMNPVRAGLCADPRDYPYSGSFTMDWKKIMRSLESWIPEWRRNSKVPA